MRLRPGRHYRRPGPMRWGPSLAGPRPAMKAAVLQALDQAHHLLNQGRPAEAAPLFAQLAEAARARGMLRQAAHLQLQAARSLADLGHGPGALSHLRAGLGLFVDAGLAGQARNVYARVLEQLRGRGMQAEADELERELQARFGSLAPDAGPGDWAPAPPAEPRGRLPAQCPNCGGPVRADEVEWIRPGPSSQADDLAQTELAAECAYCGSVLYPEE